MSTLLDLSVRLADLLAAPTPSPSPSYGQGLGADEISPGLLGFIPVFLIALACVGLFWSFTKHMRIASVRAARVEAEEAAAREQGAARVDGTDAPAASPEDEPRER